MITAFPGCLHEELTSAECKRVLRPLLDELKPDAMAIASWAGPPSPTFLTDVILAFNSAHL